MIFFRFRYRWNVYFSFPLLLTLILFSADETGASIEKPMATLVYIHGESYEWNSGNLYDGTVLAAHSNIIVVTINFRLGVLGEFKSCCARLGLHKATVAPLVTQKKYTKQAQRIWLFTDRAKMFYGRTIYGTQIILKNINCETFEKFENSCFYGFVRSFMVFFRAKNFTSN